MIELREYQVKAVDELLDKATTLLSGHSRQQKLVFKAPTGAGKISGVPSPRANGDPFDAAWGKYACCNPVAVGVKLSGHSA